MTTISEAAAAGGVSRQAVQGWCRDGWVKAVKNAGRWELDPQSLGRHLQLTHQVCQVFTEAGGSPGNPGGSGEDVRRVHLPPRLWQAWAGLDVEKTDTGRPNAVSVDGRGLTDRNGGSGQITQAVQEVFLDAADLAVHVHGYAEADQIPILWADTGREDRLDLLARIAQGVTAYTGYATCEPRRDWGRRSTPVGYVIPLIWQHLRDLPEAVWQIAEAPPKPEEGLTMLDTPREDLITDTPRRRLQDLMDLIDHTPGWRVEHIPGTGFRILGPDKAVLNVLPDPTDAELAGLQISLKEDGWDYQEALESIAARDALYADFASQSFPDYPKQDRVVTRAQARDLIRLSDECGCNWRPPKASVIKRYSEAMGRGQWQWMHPQPLILSAEHGCLLDGRQRMEGLLDSGLSQMGFTFLLHVPKEMFKYLDQGSTRSVSDILAGTGMARRVRTKVGPAVALAVRFDSGVPWKSWKDVTVPAPEISDLVRPADPEAGVQAGPYAEMPGKPYADGLTLSEHRSDGTGCKMLPSVATALSFLVRRDQVRAGVPRERALADWEEFRTALVYGEHLARGDARLALRNQLIARDKKVERRYGSQLQLGAALLAWAYWSAGVPADQIQFKASQQMPKVWVPGMPLPGTDPRRSARERQATQARRAAAEGLAVPVRDEALEQEFDFDGQ